MLLGFRFGVIATLLFHASASRGAPNAEVHLDYERGRGAETCPDEDELRRAVAARLGYDPFSTTAKRTVKVRLERHPRELEGRLEVRDEQGTITGARELRSPTRDCQELVAAISIAVAIGVDPIHGMAGPSPQTTAPPASASSAGTAASVDPGSANIATADRRPEPTATTEAPKAPLVLRGTAGVLVAVGAAPSPAFGFALGVGVRRELFSLGIEGRADLPSSADVPGGIVKASILLGSLVPCLHYRAFSGCGVLGLGAFRAEGQGVTNPAHVTKPYGAIGGRLAAEIPLVSALAFRVHADILATLSETTIVLDERPVWTTPVLSGALGAGFASIW